MPILARWRAGNTDSASLKKVVLGDPPLLCPIPQTCPLLCGQPLPLNLGHASAAKYQCPKFIDQPVLLGRVVVVKILFQSLEEFPFTILLALQA
jgi:hypothetical protein